MPIPWLRLVDGLLSASDVVKWVRGTPRPAADESLAAMRPIEQQMSGLVIGALKEVFDRDRERLEIERQRAEEEQRRAERALRLELLRQAGEREIGRLRLISAMAFLSLIALLVLASRLELPAGPGRTTFALGAALFIAALASAFAAQQRVGQAMAQANDRGTVDDVTATPTGAAALWLVAAGLASVTGAFLLR